MHMLQKHAVITLDGPAASGKSTIAKRIAHQLGYYYLYTGLLYRAVGYILAQQQYGNEIPLQHNLNIVIPENRDFIADIKYQYRDGKPVIEYHGAEITQHLSNAIMDQPASIVSAHQAIRAALLPIQRLVAVNYDLVADGRDCGSVVFSDAAVKFFITADVQARAERVYNDHKRAYSGMTIDQIRSMLVERDNRDQMRSVAPLIIPEGACIIDTTNLSIEQAVDVCMKVIRQVLSGRG